MLPRHESTWQRSVILDSIKASTREIQRDPATILGLVESWCAYTNTFGESTITLEDVLILGGSSALGEYVFPTHPADTIGRNVFSIDVRFAKGTQIALGHAVLASLYRDLGLMKGNMDSDTPNSVVWAPFELLQKWSWERFPPLCQESDPITLSFVRRTLKSKKDFH
ncbi:protein MAIN-LIKE 2-like protein [Cinnamomum micranthum f. kanehirae]|uniref:Protein MAIN-LIKE 2-like protein n=1 Tax=Cinnamomum micranthum f. kanehirae TaxID=337451 RepID=A0A3S3Q5T6_9MAGN|nr:protein MAIN-LIKE 2-like protein [Cinnamomum micranthum f. kanehirae]